MEKRQVLALCVCTVVVYAGIGGLIGLMPVHLTRLGADPTATGAVLACAYLALALSNVVAGPLTDRFRHPRALLILGGALATPLIWLLRRADTVVQVGLVLAGVWCAIGLPMTVARILIGQAADAAHQGRSFGLLTLSSGIGLFVGTLVSGPIVGRWGFHTLFAAFAVVFLLVPVAGWFVREPAVRRARSVRPAPATGFFRQRTFIILFAANICGQAANIVIFLSRPLLMEARHFDTTTISTAAALGSVATLPLPLLVGWLTDHVGRKPLLLGCFLAPVLGLLVQLVATQPWHFALSNLFSTVVGVGIVVASALVAGLFPEQTRGTAIALLNATTWFGLVVGLVGGGLAIRLLAMSHALLLAGLVGLVALLLLLTLSGRESAYGSAAQTNREPA